MVAATDDLVERVVARVDDDGLIVVVKGDLVVVLLIVVLVLDTGESATQIPPSQCVPSGHD